MCSVPKFSGTLLQITLADFIMADVTDSVLDGMIDGFPTTYATKVGKTSDAMYKAWAARLAHVERIFR